MTDEWAKATQEVAKTAGKAVEAITDLGTFIARYAGGPAEQASRLAKIYLTHLVWERQVRFMSRAEALLTELGLDAPTRPVPLKIAIPIMQQASMEEDNELQDLWARLWVNAADAESDVEPRHSLITIVSDFSRLDAQILSKLCEADPELKDDGVRTAGLPDEIVAAPTGKKIGQPRRDVELALWNLQRLSCVASAMAFPDGKRAMSSVYVTTLGEEVYRACTLRPARNS